MAKNPNRFVATVLWSNLFVLALKQKLDRYSVVKRTDNSQRLLLAAERKAGLASLLGTELETVGTFTGDVNTRCVQTHCSPYPDRTRPFSMTRKPQ